ncbi:hypothetical protein CLE01_17800 [Cryobacterium levicorallinum]|uniref:L-arabinose isomerase n=1 Tax=Cryobacterium levicorallinum TaxID=995038 RepID=A0ABY1EA89_9MICO|nr:hypothetical protein CLE01_17800 [Cryobacterium levicorallinum]SFH26238.1 L-arabinose isomerase [Cryobacterium levicorallinum]
MAADRTTVTSSAGGTEVLHDFAEIARTELLVIDKTTTLRDFTREVRWNQAYYRLAQGLYLLHNPAISHQ